MGMNEWTTRMNQSLDPSDQSGENDTRPETAGRQLKGKQDKQRWNGVDRYKCCELSANTFAYCGINWTLIRHVNTFGIQASTRLCWKKQQMVREEIILISLEHEPSHLYTQPQVCSAIFSKLVPSLSCGSSLAPVLDRGLWQYNAVSSWFVDVARSFLPPQQFSLTPQKMPG